MVRGDMPHEIMLSDLVVTKKPEQVYNEIKIIISMGFDDFDFQTLETVYFDIVRLFNGEYPGYRGCTTEYHSLSHTIETFLAMARLMNGYLIDGKYISERSVSLGLISALMHDTGYIQTLDDNSGTGAKYTLSHISRSILFMEQYFTDHGFSEEDIAFCTNCIRCTNINTKMKEIDFSSPEEEIMGKMLGIADLISQISDRNYLEKLIFLYLEFTEGNVQGFESELDLFNKTIGFIDFTMKRFVEELGELNKYMINHFKVRWSIDGDLYMNSIEKNVNYLKYIVENKGDDLRNHLRRYGTFNQLYDTVLLPQTC